MSDIALQVKRRETGKQVSKRLRKSGMAPGVYYAQNQEPMHIVAEPLALRPIVYTAHAKFINLTVEGDSKVYNCVLKDVDFDPITDEIIHFDLLGVVGDHKITVEVPVVYEGTPIGVRNGGILQQIVHKIEVTCLPKDMPDSVHVNVENLDLGHSIHLNEIELGNVETVLAFDSVLATVVKPRLGAVGHEEEGTLEAEAKKNEDND